MLEDLSVGTFSGRLGSSVRIYPDDSSPLEMELISAIERGESSRRPFSMWDAAPKALRCASASTGWSTRRS